MAIISNAVTIADAGAFSVNLGSMVLIKTITASSDSTISFVDGASSVVFDNTYPIYKFEFINIHPGTNSVTFGFQADTGTNTNYNQTITSTSFRAQHNEAGDTNGIGYKTAHDLGQGTDFQHLTQNGQGGDNDQCFCGHLFIFNPSSSTFVKHFTSEANNSRSIDYTYHSFIAGYGNTTSAVDAIQFKNSSNNIDSGTIKMYGIV